MKSVGNSGHQKSDLSVTRVLLLYLRQVVVSLVSSNYFLVLFSKEILGEEVSISSHSVTSLLFPHYEHKKWSCWEKRKISSLFSESGNMPKSITAEQIGTNTPMDCLEYIGVLTFLQPEAEVLPLCLIPLTAFFPSSSSFLTNSGYILLQQLICSQDDIYPQIFMIWQLCHSHHCQDVAVVQGNPGFLTSMVFQKFRSAQGWVTVLQRDFHILCWKYRNGCWELS